MARHGIALVLCAGILLVVLARLALPSAPPLYDGIFPVEPYVWLDPPAGKLGGAMGATADVPIRSGTSPLVAVATPELEPQGQIFAPPGGLTLTAGARTIRVSIQPVASEVAPTDGHIDGNVYRIVIADDKGNALTAPASAQVTVVLRATDPTQADATIARLTAGAWQPLKTSSSGFGGIFIAVASEFGDFAVIVPGAVPTTPGTLSATPFLGASIAASALPGLSPTPNVPTSPGAAFGLSALLPFAIAVVAIGLAVYLYRLAMRRRRDRSRGAHRSRRR
jgi:hypothetical protein